MRDLVAVGFYDFIWLLSHEVHLTGPTRRDFLERHVQLSENTVYLGDPVTG